MDSFGNTNPKWIVHLINISQRFVTYIYGYQSLIGSLKIDFVLLEIAFPFPFPKIIRFRFSVWQNALIFGLLSVRQPYFGSSLWIPKKDEKYKCPQREIKNCCLAITIKFEGFSSAGFDEACAIDRRSLS